MGFGIILQYFLKIRISHYIVKLVSVFNATHLARFSFKKARQMTERFASKKIIKRMFRLTRLIWHLYDTKGVVNSNAS